MNRSQSPSTALRAPSPPLGEKDGMRGVRFMEREKIGRECAVRFGEHIFSSNSETREIRRSRWESRPNARYLRDEFWMASTARKATGSPATAPLPFDCWSRTKSTKVVCQVWSAFCAPAHGCYL